MADQKPFVTIIHGCRGYFAALMVWAEDCGGSYEPWNTGSHTVETSCK